MYKVFPALILRAAMVRARSLELGGVNDYYTSSSAPSSSTLVAAAPSATNAYVLAFGEREGLAPGERLEVYGNRLRLVRTLAYGCPRGVTVQSAFTGRLTEADLAEITEQLEALNPCGTDMRKLITLQLHRSSGKQGQQQRTPNWTLRLPEIKHSRVLRSALPADTSSLAGAQLSAQLKRLRQSPEEVVVAEWVRHSSEATRPANAGAAPATVAADPPTMTALTDGNGVLLTARKEKVADEDVSDALLMENGVCFHSADSCGLRALRTSRLAFISSIERTANGLARRQRRLSGEELRALEVLDVNAIDFTFAHAALQSTLELGLHTGDACRITHVPLTDAAAQRVETQAASYIRVVAAGPEKALQRPFDYMPTHAFDVGAYTAYVPLPLGPLTAAEKAGTCDSPAGEDASCPTSRKQQQQQQQRCRHAEAGVGGTRLDRQQLATQLSHAMATLRRGACMLVTFVPTPATVAALYHEMETQHHAEVLIEHRMVAHSKACIAEAISRTGRWGYITDEVLPAVDSPQGSSFSLMVVLE